MVGFRRQLGVRMVPELDYQAIVESYTSRYLPIATRCTLSFLSEIGIFSATACTAAN